MKKISKKIKLLFAAFLSASLLCTPISSFDHSDTVKMPETFNFESEAFKDLNHNPSSFSEEDARLIQEIQNNPSLINDLQECEIDYSVEFDSSLPHANSNISVQTTNASDTVA